MKYENQLERRLTSYLSKVLKGYSKDKNKYFKNDVNIYKEFTKEIDEKLSINKYRENEFIDEFNLEYMHPEELFSNDKYYFAMNKVPKMQKQVLYLLSVDILSKEKVSQILNIKETSVKRLKALAIENFKKNLE